MSTRYADVFADLTADATGATENRRVENRPPGNQLQRHVKCAHVRYTLKGDEANADVVRLVKLKKGCRVLPRESGIYTLVDPGTTLTGTVGDLDSESPTPLVDNDADRYSGALTLSAIGYDAFTGGAAETAPYSLREDAWITFTIVSIVTGNDDGVLEFEIFYLDPGPETYDPAP
jgi:hypothetical protein